jgi:hypothetical protein
MDVQHFFGRKLLGKKSCPPTFHDLEKKFLWQFFARPVERIDVTFCTCAVNAVTGIVFVH